VAKVDEDVKTLERYYKNLGFLTARIGRELHFDESQTYCTLKFVIDEGPRCQINNVRFIGVNKFREEDIQGMLQLTAGQPFDGGLLARDKATIEQVYGSYGYVFADVKPEPQVTEDASRMDLVYVIGEGKRYRVGEIKVQIDGEHPHTNIRTVLNRIELQPGDIVDVRKLRRSEIRLQRSQLFAVDPQRGIRPQLVVQPRDDPDGQFLAGKPKDSAAKSGSTNSSASGTGQRLSRPKPGRLAAGRPSDLPAADRPGESPVWTVADRTAAAATAGRSARWALSAANERLRSAATGAVATAVHGHAVACAIGQYACAGS
jgi:outer membrane protein insertion porin family